MVIFARTSRLVAVLVVLVAMSVGVAQRSDAATTVKLTGYGADSCTAPSESQMRAFWTNTPYSYWGIYLGGSDRGCAQPNLTATWVSHVISMGWDLLPIWVGPQNPCTPGQASYFSTNPTTAASQGKAQALAAYNAWRTLSSQSNVPIDYDLEAGGTWTTTCRTAAKAFINAWVAQLHVAPAQTAGVYSSSCAGHLDDYATIAHPPDFIDGADWDGVPSTGSISCVASNHWTLHQRHKQYRGGHNATYNGVTLNIDSRCADGAVYGSASRLSSTQACARTAAAVSATPAVTAGPVTWHGTQWQAGGPLDSQLQRRTAAGWARVAVPGATTATHEVAVDVATVGVPIALADGSLLVPLTEHDGATARTVLLTTRDGVRFARRATVRLGAGLASGVAATTAPASGSAVVVFDPDARAVHEWSPSGVTSRPSRGLPAAPTAARLSGATGTAVVESGECSGGKSGCAPQVRTLHTTDGGRTWH